MKGSTFIAIYICHCIYLKKNLKKNTSRKIPKDYLMKFPEDSAKRNLGSVVVIPDIDFQAQCKSFCLIYCISFYVCTSFNKSLHML